MSELDPKAKALLRATQFADEPSQDDYDRVHASLSARIAVGVAAGAAVTTVAKTAAAHASAVGAGGAAASASVGAAAGTATAGASIAAPAMVAAGASLGTGVASTLPVVKIVAWVVAASMTVGTGAVVVTKSYAPKVSPAPTAALMAPAAAPATPIAPAKRVAAPGGPTASSVIPDPTSPIPPVNPLPTATAPVQATAPAVVKLAPASSAASLEAEVALIRDARVALSHDDAAHALALLDEHARRFPDGVMSQDRDAVQVFATCAAGQTDAARELAARFLKLHPGSTYAASVSASCASPSAVQK